MVGLKRRDVERGWSEVGGVGLLGGGGVDVMGRGVIVAMRHPVEPRDRRRCWISRGVIHSC